MQHPRAHHRAQTRSQSNNKHCPARAALCVAAALAMLAGCANSALTQSTANQSSSTGNEDIDRAMSMMEQWDAMEESFDLEALAAEASQKSTPAENTASTVAVSQSNQITPATTEQPIAQAAETATTQSNLYSRPFLVDENEFGDPDPFEIELAQFNAPAGLLGSGDPENVESKANETPLDERLADLIQSETGDPFTRALAQVGLSPIVGLAPETDGTLSVEAAEIIDAYRTMLTDLSRLGSDPDPDEAAAIARVFSDSLNQNRPIEITTAVLCSRVDGFGSYTQLRDTPPHFMSGRTNPTIVYVEVDHFSHAPLTSSYRGPDRGDAQQWEVRLSQEINLYRAHETVPVWTLPASMLTDISRNKRRDFHVTNQITLPSSLALGMYKLKVTMRDLVSGDEAERMIPIQIVNDAGLLSSD